MLTAKSRESPKTKAEGTAGRTTSKVETVDRIQPSPLWHQLATRVQAKLTVSAPDDPYEREADRVADQVMRMPDRPSSHQELSFPSIHAYTAQRECAACEEEEEKLQRKESGSAAEAPTTVPRIVHKALSTPGQPLEAATRAYFGSRFGHDFDDVRVHTGAAASANSLQANAYTVGSDIVLRDAYDPASTAGGTLLAHELTHVVQQRGASPATQTAGEVSDPADASEREAEAVAERVVAGERVQVSAPRTSTIARDRRSPDATFHGYQSFLLNGVVPAANAQVRVQFHQDASSPSAATLAVWYQESNTLQTVTFDPGGTIQAAVLSEEPGIVTFDLNGDEAPEIVLTARPNALMGLDFAADFRGRRILDMTTAPPQPRAPPYVAGRGRLIGQLPDGRNYYFTGVFDQRGPRYVDDNGMAVDPGQEAAAAEINKVVMHFLVGWMILSAGIALTFLAVEGALALLARAAAPAAAGGAYAGLTNAQIAQQFIGVEGAALLRTFFGTALRGAAARAAAFELPAGLTRAMLLAYAEIARRVIAAGNDTLGVQAARLQLVERALRLLP